LNNHQIDMWNIFTMSSQISLSRNIIILDKSHFNNQIKSNQIKSNQIELNWIELTISIDWSLRCSWLIPLICLITIHLNAIKTRHSIFQLKMPYNIFHSSFRLISSHFFSFLFISFHFLSFPSFQIMSFHFNHLNVVNSEMSFLSLNSTPLQIFMNSRTIH
jgi:hypothetical protein